MDSGRDRKKEQMKNTWVEKLFGDDEFPSEEDDAGIHSREIGAAQIRAYMSLEVSDETVRLAAAMAPKVDTFDPAILIDRALILRTEVEARLLHRRKFMATKMLPSTLLMLLERLGVENTSYEKIRNMSKFDPIMVDPVIGPAISVLRLRLTSGMRKRLDESEIESALIAADSRTKLSRPIFPCSREEGLRYAANAPDAPKESLVRTWVDYLCCLPAFDEDESNEKSMPLKMRENRSTNRANEPMKKTGKKKASTTKKVAEGPYKSKGKRGNTILIKHNPNIISELEMAEHAAGFHEYWKSQIDYEEREQLIKDKISTGASIRDRKLWVGRTEDFMESNAFKTFLERSSQSHELFADAVNAFLESYDAKGSKSPSSKKKVSKFLLSLFAFKNGNMNDSRLEKLRQRLGKHKIVAISSDVIRECRDRLNAGLDSGDRSDS